jgi:hypothetical protein
MDSIKNGELDMYVYQYGRENYRKGLFDGIMVGVILSFFMVAATQRSS